MSTRPVDTADAPVLKSAIVRIAEAMGWTAGQAWTVAIGAAIAVPAAVFGLGPVLNGVPGGVPTAAPQIGRPAAAPAAPGAKPPAILGEVPVPPPLSVAAPAGFAGAPGAVVLETQPDEPAASAVGIGDLITTIGGPGRVQAIAVAADGVAVAVDRGAGEPGRVVVLDASGNVAADRVLRVGDVSYEQPGGIALSDDGILVTTSRPAAVVRLDAVAGTVSKVADVPDVPVCVPVAASTNCQPRVPDSAPRPQHLALADDGDVYVADQGQACILRIRAGDARAKTWLCDLSFSSSPASPNGGLVGLAAATDRVVFTLAAGLNGSESVQQAAIAPTGAPGERKELAKPASGAGASGVAIMPDGRVVVALANSAQLLVVEADGSKSRTVPLEDVKGPVDLDVIDDRLLIAHRVEGSAGRVTTRATSAF